MRILLWATLCTAILTAAPGLAGPALAADELNGADTAWIITATALVLFMTLPGLALFYAGFVRAQAVLSVIMQCFAICCIVSVLWLTFVYSLAFGEDIGGIIGGFDKVMLLGIGPDVLSGTIPEVLFFAFQMTFAVIAPALIVGAYIERMRFGPVLLFSGLWVIVVYAPVCHWVWGGGWLAERGIMDFAGGIVVHATAGVSALVLAARLGARRGFPEQARPPHNSSMAATGAAMLWVGWFGFNGGSQLAADGGASMAIVVTHISASTAAIVWVAIEWIKFGKPTLIGAVTGVIAGLASITPASGFVGPVGALVIGALSGALCFWSVGLVKARFRIDDSIDIFAVHGVGGILGTLLVSGLALSIFGGGGLADGVTPLGQLGVQTLGLVAAIAWSALATFVLVEIISRVCGGLRIDPDEEIEGLDIHAHGEHGYYI